MGQLTVAATAALVSLDILFDRVIFFFLSSPRTRTLSGPLADATITRRGDFRLRPPRHLKDLFT
jgi:hypothetical protein